MIIYLTTNLITGEKYIGKDRNNISSYMGGGVELKKAIKKYGKENFKKEILEICNDLIHLKEREEHWLNNFDVKNNPNFYNKTNKSYGSDYGPSKTEKYLNRGKKISNVKRGIKQPNISKALKGYPKPKVSKALKGKKKTKEHCLNISISKKGIISKRKGKPDLKQRGVPKPGAGKGPKPGAGPKEGNHILDIKNNIIYKSVKECRIKNKIGVTKMFKLLKDPNSNFRYFNKNYFKN